MAPDSTMVRQSAAVRYVRTLQQLAVALEVSSTTIARWRNEWGGFPNRTAKGWDVAATKKWRESKNLERRVKKARATSVGKRHDRPTYAGRPPKERENDPPADGEVEINQADLSLYDLDAEKKRAETQYRRAKAEMAQMQADELKGSLVKRAEVEQMFADRVHEVASKLDGLGRGLAPRLVGLHAREIEKEINAATRAIREHFARARPL